MKPTFRIHKRSRAGRARLGVLRTPHGTVQTPAYVIVATHAQVRTLTPADIKKTKTQLVIANTYHLWGRRDAHRMLGARIPMMTDSGGFQVFSLGAAKDHRVGKVLKRGHRTTSDGNDFSTVSITEKGAAIRVEGSRLMITPESSIATQESLGADIIFVFDECTSPLHPLAYTKNSMERTHRWALRSLRAHARRDQLLYGIVQGGRFKRLRVASAKTLAALPFGGYGIGGSFGKDEMAATLATVVPHLPDDKPRHLLGIGSVQDIFIAVEAGIDTMDCVVPTREARHARIYTDDGIVDVRKVKYADDVRPLLVSRASIGRLHRLFRAHDQRAGRLATLHNVRWFNLLLERIRAALADGSYVRFKKQFLTRFSPPRREPSVARPKTRIRRGSRGSRAYSPRAER
ncbi:MAG: tRNA guanosine(34) transglycosylase Tgt [Candidatus Yanofskybacteria bacterium]|nr:tRNA guanosine(34) transglycosylase Tgt [Candidatus Yanofskybacteria bacterium]